MVNLTLTDIIRYEDVERGRLVLIAGDRQKSWKATCMTNLRINFTEDRSMPRGCLPLNLKRCKAPWPICPLLKLNRRTKMWIEPLNCVRWTDFGVNLYLCDEADYFRPLGRGEYQMFVEALCYYGIDTLTVEPPRLVKHEPVYQHEFESEFWSM